MRQKKDRNCPVSLPLDFVKLDQTATGHKEKKKKEEKEGKKQEKNEPKKE